MYIIRYNIKCFEKQVEKEGFQSPKCIFVKMGIDNYCIRYIIQWYKGSKAKGGCRWMN